MKACTVYNITCDTIILTTANTHLFIWWKRLAREKYFVDCVSISLVASSFKHTNQVVVGGSRAKLCFHISNAALLVKREDTIIIIITVVF